MSARLPFTLASCSTAGFVLQLYALPRLTRVSGNCLRPSAVPRQTLYSLDKNIPLGPTSPYISPQIYWRYSRLPAPTCIRASSRAAHNRTAVTSASTLNALPGACMACCCRERCQFKNKMRGIKPNSTAKHQIQQQNGREITCSACCICRGMAAHIRTLWRFEMRVTQALAATLRVHKTTPAIAKLHHRICGWSSHIYRRNWPTQLQQLWCN